MARPTPRPASGTTGRATEEAATHALILAHGDPPAPELLERLVKDADLFIATDGAANALAAAGPRPHVVLGDFDSLGADARDLLPDAEFVRAFDQEASDLDKAIAYARGRGADRLTVVGASGGRIDHALTAISLLLKHAGSLDIRLVDDHGEVRAVASEAIVLGAEGDTLSLVAFGTVEGVTAEGVRWPLRGERLQPGSRGVSNVMTGDIARVSVSSGVLILCHLQAAR